MRDARESEKEKELQKSYTHVRNRSIVDRVVEKNRESGEFHLLSCRGVVRNKTICEEKENTSFCYFYFFTPVC